MLFPEIYRLLIISCIICRLKATSTRIPLPTTSYTERPFPKDFIFGVATSAYQIEGAWNTDGKSPSMWDVYTQQEGLLPTNDNGNVAADSYNRREDDINMLIALGVKSYRFSLSWTRIMPNSFLNEINPAGVDYYNNLINDLLSNGIEPIVTIHHFDVPWDLHNLGSWSNPLIIDRFVDYARLAFRLFGDRVRNWLTINEPKIFCWVLYGGKQSLFKNTWGHGEYVCGHNILKAHARVYRLYQEEFKRAQNGRIGIPLDDFWFEPATDSKEDVDAAERKLQFTLGWFADPIVHGDYPDAMKTYIANASAEEGFSSSRLPTFTKQESEMMKGTYDYFALNYYSAYLTEAANATESDDPFHKKASDTRTKVYAEENWPDSAVTWLKNTPWGLRKLLKWIKDRYNDPEILITENGYADYGTLCDVGRIRYIQDHLNAILEAIHVDHVNVRGYYTWTLMDDFEWFDGYKIAFGLYRVDYNSDARTRTPKYSAEMYGRIIEENRLINDVMDEGFCENKNVFLRLYKIVQRMLSRMLSILLAVFVILCVYGFGTIVCHLFSN